MSETTNETAEGKKVLIVDDDEFLLDMYAIKFREAGFSVEVAHDGKEALQKVESVKPEIVLLDIILPGMDGFEVLRSLYQEKRADNMMVVMLTNLGQKDDAERGIQLGARDYIVKAHFTPTEVVEKVRQLLREQ